MGLKYVIVAPMVDVLTRDAVTRTVLREGPAEDSYRLSRPNGRRSGGNSRIPEVLLARLWQKRAARQRSFHTEAGRLVRVIYPGRSGTAAGPDFLDALLEVEGVGLVRGDVEIHVRQSDWRHHGHGQDPNYNGVVLHAALKVESSTTDLRSGQQAHVVSLEPLLGTPEPPEAGPNAALWEVLGRQGYCRPETSGEAAALLDQAGDRRFLVKSAYLSTLLSEQDPDQTLYEGIMEGLGYHANQQPFLKLAGRAPYSALVTALRVPRFPGFPGFPGVPGFHENRAQALEGWLFNLAGFSPELPGTDSTGHGKPTRPPPKAGFGTAMAAQEWHCFRLRPSNHPRRRIAGAARLLDRFLDQGLAAGLRQAADQGSPRRLTEALTVGDGQSQGQAYIGKGRAADLAVNGVLPFLNAWAGAGISQSGAGDAGNYLETYQRFGKLQDNNLIREMREQLLEPSWLAVVNSARRQQGLLHLHSVLLGAG